MNVKGSAEQTDEYVVPNAYDPQHDEIEQHTNGKDPDWYAMGNVCDIAPDGKTFKLNALRSDSSVDPAQTETIPIPVCPCRVITTTRSMDKTGKLCGRTCGIPSERRTDSAKTGGAE